MTLTTDEEAFASRALDLEVATQCNASFANGQFRFDYVRGGVLRFTKVRDPAKSYHFIEPAGSDLFLWGIDELTDVPDSTDDPLIITEGEFDKIAVRQSGIGVHCVSVPNGGSSAKTRQGSVIVSEDTGFAYLWDENEKLIRELDKFRKIILWTDDDEVGMALRDELALRIGESRCWHVPSTNRFGAKDANDVLIQWGLEGVKRAVAKASPMRPGKLLKPSELPERRFERIYETGWPWLNPHMKLKRPELIVVTGIPGHGKGTWARALCCNLAEHNGLRAAMLTPEDPPHIVKRGLVRFGQRMHSHATPEQQKAAHEWADEYFRISMPPEDETITMDFVKNEMASAAMHHECQVFLLDPWNEISHDYGRSNVTQYIEHALVDLKQHARRYGLILIIVAHPKKRDRDGPPGPYDISDSAHWFNKADHTVTIHRGGKGAADAKSGLRKLGKKSLIIIGKSKDHETMGEPGQKVARFEKEKFDYIEEQGDIDEG